MPENDLPPDLRARLTSLRDAKPLHFGVLHAPRKLTFDMLPEIALRTLREIVDFVLDSEVPDAVTRAELANYVLVEADKVPVGQTTVMILNGPIGSSGFVVRPNRSPAEIEALLANPNLPLDVRNMFEAQLGRPLTPPPANIRRASTKNLPQVFDESGVLVPYSKFEIDQDAGGTTRMVFSADGVIAPSKIMTGAGQDVPIVPGFAFRRGVSLTLPFLFTNRPTKVTAVGTLFRNGKVVRDIPTPETEAADRQAEAVHLAETRDLVRLAVAEGRPRPSLKAIITGRSYRDDEADALLDVLLAEINR